MVKILVCNLCRRELEKTNHLDLYSTYRSIIFGCQHSIEQLKRDVDEQVKLAREMGDIRAGVRVTSNVIKHSKVEFKQGRFQVKSDKTSAGRGRSRASGTNG